MSSCGGQSSPASKGATAPDTPIGVVASTEIYGDIARDVGGDAVEVTVLIDDPDIDPHEFQGTARDVLALSRADVVIVNGGGYDGFMGQLLDAADNPSARLIDMVELVGMPDNGNEHVFYDPANIRALVGELATALTEAHPNGASQFAEAARSVDHDLDELSEQAEGIASRADGVPTVATDPAAEAFAGVVGLDNRAPEAFMIAVEDGTGVAPRMIRQVLDLVGDGTIKMVVTETGVVDPQVKELLDAARAGNVPVVTVTEMLPQGDGYVSWMHDNFSRIDRALGDTP